MRYSNHANERKRSLANCGSREREAAFLLILFHLYGSAEAIEMAPFVRRRERSIARGWNLSLEGAPLNLWAAVDGREKVSSAPLAEKHMRRHSLYPHARRRMRMTHLVDWRLLSWLSSPSSSG